MRETNRNEQGPIGEENSQGMSANSVATQWLYHRLAVFAVFPTGDKVKQSEDGQCWIGLDSDRIDSVSPSGNGVCTTK